MYDAIQFCVNWGCDEVTEVVVEETCVRQGCSLHPYIFDIFIDDVIDYVGEGNNCTVVDEKPTTPGVLFTGDLAMGCFAVGSVTCEFRFKPQKIKVKGFEKSKESEGNIMLGYA
jgi:hypothetical protein